MAENPSSNVFTQPMSQFQVLETVPNIIQQVGVDVDQATDVDLIPPTPDVLSVNDVHPATSGLASSSTITPVEAIPTGTSQTGTSTGPDPTDSSYIQCNRPKIIELDSGTLFTIGAGTNKLLHRAVVCRFCKLSRVVNK
jgi:hypothetical protein